MSEAKIGQGAGNLVADSQYKAFLLAEACDAGDGVCLSGATGYTVEQCDAATDDGIGVLMADGAADEWVVVCIGGYCAVAAVDTGCSAGEFVAATTTSGIGVGSATKTELSYAVALADDVAGFTSVMVFNKFGV